MKITLKILALTALLCLGCQEGNKTKESVDMATANTADSDVQESQKSLKITPVEHATAVLEWGDITIYIDPVGEAASFAGFPQPDLILITDVHGDHLSAETLEGLTTSAARIVVPQAVAYQLPEQFSASTVVMNNGESRKLFGVKVEAIPMYNLREEARNFHVKGRGNGYVITLGKERLYFSGDTEDIPEMRSLENIDKAFVCMNLPYTMTVDRAADAVLEFKPKQVYPYHYRGRPEVSDVARFAELVSSKDPNIEVVQLDWYPANSH